MKKALVDRICKLIERILPRKWLQRLGNLLDMGGINTSPEMFAGLIFTWSICIGVFVFFGTIPFGYVNALLSAVGIIIGFWLVVYTTIALRIDKRRRSVEDILPDFLQLAASNVRAGMPIDQALWFAAKPEFGLFSKEMEMVAKKTFGGAPFAEALNKLNVRFQSRILSRTIALITQGMASGGEIGEILETTAHNARRMQLVQKEISASLLMYIVFIIFASVIAAPILYALSYKLIGVVVYIWANIEEATGGAPLQGMVTGTGTAIITPLPPPIKPGEFYAFALASNIITSFMASLIIGVILTGTLKTGFKYLPFFVGGALGVFFVVDYIFTVLFAGIMG